MMDFSKKQLDLSSPQVMGILNVTPDSFSDGGELLQSSGKVSIDKVIKRASSMQEQGAAILDIGGESTRPGASKVSVQEEMDRVLPVVEKIHNSLDIIISVDTSSPEVITEATKLGAGLINDVRALQKPGALEAAKESDLPVVLMHMQGKPSTMQDAPSYENIIQEIMFFFNQRLKACEEAGIRRDKIILDPGFGFGKTLEHNLELLGRLSEFKPLKLPLLIGLSRKKMLGLIVEQNKNLNEQSKKPHERLVAGLSAALIGLQQGVQIVRTHDVAETVDVIKVYQAVFKKV